MPSDDLRVFQPDRPSDDSDDVINCAYYLYQSDWREAASQVLNDQRALHVMALRTAFNEPLLTGFIRFSVSCEPTPTPLLALICCTYVSA